MGENPIVDALGWLGAVALLGAYALVSTRRLAGDAVRFQLLNLIGGALLIVNSAFYGAIPSVGVNVFWIGIALFAIIKKLRSRLT
jgi:hypothetical protein